MPDPSKVQGSPQEFWDFCIDAHDEALAFRVHTPEECHNWIVSINRLVKMEANMVEMALDHLTQGSAQQDEQKAAPSTSPALPEEASHGIFASSSGSDY